MPESLRRRALLLAPLALAACGFAPAYAPGGPGGRLRGRLAVDAPDSADGFRLRARLEDRLGRAEAPVARLSVEPVTEVREGAFDPDGAAARATLAGRAPWRLVSPSGTVLASGEARAATGATLAGSLVAVREAEEDARARLMTLLADAVVAQLLLSEGLP